MNQKTQKIIQIVYAVLITAALAVAGLCLMVACVGIYRSGDRPFSREAVAAAFGGIAVPVYAAIGMVVVGFVLSLFLPAEPKNKKADMTLSLWRRLSARAVVNGDAAVAVAKERRLRRVHRLITLGLLLVGAVAFLLYACNFEHFHRTEINPSMVRAMWVLLPSVGVPFLYAVLTACLSRKSLLREIAVLRECPQHDPDPAPHDGHLLIAVRVALLAVAVIGIVVGLLGNGFADVLTKAVNICTECIGLG